MDQFLEKIKPVPKVWAPVVAGLAAIIANALITGEVNETEVKGLLLLVFYAVIGWTVPTGPVVHDHDSDEIVVNEQTARARLAKKWRYQDEAAELSE